MNKKTIIFSVVVFFYISPVSADASVIVEQVQSDNIKIIEKKPATIKNDINDKSGKKNAEKTNANDQSPPANLAVRERERANIIINQQNYSPNKENINDVGVEQRNKKTIKLLEQEKKDIRAKKKQTKKKHLPSVSNEKLIEEFDYLM